MKAVIDSDILIDYLQGREAARVELGRYDRALYSVISWMEVLCGAKTTAAQKSAETLFASLQRVDLSLEIAQKAVAERRKTGLKLPDAISLATADHAGCILVTRNTKDFDPTDPRVRIPYSI